MEKLELIKPNKNSEKNILDIVKEFEKDNSVYYWSSWLKHFLDNYDWRLENIQNNENKDTVAEWIVPAFQYILIRESENKAIWFINTRLELSEWLLQHWWHIWYSIRPSERRKHYATAQLFAVLKLYKDLWIDRVLVTCDKDNIWSAKTIQKCGWILENEIIDSTDWKLIQRYWIDIDNWIKLWIKFFEDNWLNIEIL